MKKSIEGRMKIKQPNFNHPNSITGGVGYKNLLRAVLHDYENDREYQQGNKPFHDYKAKFNWVVERALKYAEKINCSPDEVLDAWEHDRSEWYMNYYQDYNQPDPEKVRVYANIDAFKKACANKGFICPSCGGISTNPSRCDTHRLVKRGRKKIECDWSACGLFGTMGKGAVVFIRNRMTIYRIFMPVAWQNKDGTENAAHRP